MNNTKEYLLIVMMFSFSAFAENHPWPCWRGPNHDGKSPATGLLKKWPEGGPELLWKADVLGKGFSTISASDSLIYTTGDINDELILFAIDMEGNIKWKVPVDKAWNKSHPGSRSTPTIDGNRVYLLSGNGIIACFDALSGEKIWSKDLKSLGGKSGGWGYSESVLLYQDLAIAKAGGENCIIAFKKDSGDIVWKSSGFKADPEYSSCVPFTYQDIPMIATGTKAGIVCVSAKSGKLLWSNDWCAGNTANCPDPVYNDGYIFWANGYGKGGICLKLSVSEGIVSAQEVWTTKDMICHHGGYIIHDGYIYGNHNNGWSCLELKTGKVMWHEKAVGKGSLCFADGMLYLFGEEDGKVALTNCTPDGMEIKGTFQVQGIGTSWAHPVVIGGRLYLRYANNLYCYDISAKK
ncbi:MAG: PQQ-like beta-propeller repeat protein [Phycisphaerae bacterium]|nr:PQQ-like beta-propeller repeat protein [Phycisphaerae bacterium]